MFDRSIKVVLLVDGRQLSMDTESEPISLSLGSAIFWLRNALSRVLSLAERVSRLLYIVSSPTVHVPKYQISFSFCNMKLYAYFFILVHFKWRFYNVTLFGPNAFSNVQSVGGEFLSEKNHFFVTTVTSLKLRKR